MSDWPVGLGAAAMAFAKRLPVDWQWWQVQEDVFASLACLNEQGERGWTEADMIDASRWASAKQRRESP